MQWQPSINQIESNIWIDIQKQRKALPDVSTSLAVTYSPTVNKSIAQLILNGVNQAAKLWQVQYLPQQPLPTYFFTEKDRGWFKKQLQELGMSTANPMANFDNEVNRNSNRANWAGISGENGIIWMTYMIGTGKSSPDSNDATVAAHEYTHLAQFKVAQQHQDELACWQVEGGAHFYGQIYVKKSRNTCDWY